MDAVLRENAKIGAKGAIEALRVAGYQVSGLEIDFLFSYIFDALKRADDDREVE